MFLTLVIGLYTSRIILDTLGIEDYGIYGVVGGVVGMMGFLNSAMSGATSRFLTYELGKGNMERIIKTFSSALIVHIIIAFIVVLVAETVGLWYVKNKLVIPEGRETAAYIVYQFCILSSVLNITQVPYNSCIIAHEKMNVYAYVEILNVTLKLLIVYLLTIGDFDKLILYSFLYFMTSVLVALTYRVYCLKKFQECTFKWIWKKEYITPLISFSGWNLFGNLGGIVAFHGNNLVLNLFYGVTMNAASSIAFAVSGVVNQFASNAMTAFRPPITKLYAQKDIQGMQSLTLLAIKIILLLYTMVAIPVFIECSYLINLWLIDVPDNVVLFCKIILISIFFETIRYIIIMNIHASGKVKLVSAFSGFLFCSVPLIIYFLYKNGAPVESSFILIVIVNILLTIINIIILKKYIPSVDSTKYFLSFLKVFVSALISVLITKYITSGFAESFIRLIVTVLFSTCIQIIVFGTICITHTQRKDIYKFIKSKIHL